MKFKCLNNTAEHEGGPKVIGTGLFFRLEEVAAIEGFHNLDLSHIYCDVILKSGVKVRVLGEAIHLIDQILKGEKDESGVGASP